MLNGEKIAAEVVLDLEQYKKFTAQGSYIEAGGEEHMFMHAASREARRITAQINCGFRTAEELRALMSELVGYSLDENFGLFPPIYTDFGKNIKIGRGVFINSGCCFQDQGGIELGDGCLIGHQVVIATLNHDLSPEKRASMLPAKVTLGKNVWVGAHATILPGVTVGDNAVIAAGAVVTRDVEADTVVAGVPARVIRRLNG